MPYCVEIRCFQATTHSGDWRYNWVSYDPDMTQTPLAYIKRSLPILFITSVHLIMSACNTSATPPTSQAIPNPLTSLVITNVVQSRIPASGLESPLALPPIALPSAGLGTGTGILVDAVTKLPLVGTEVRLAPVESKNGEQAYFLDTTSSPTTVSDPSGRFVFREVPPRDYVVFVGDPFGSYTIVPTTNDKALVWSIVADKVNDLGQTEVRLPK